MAGTISGQEFQAAALFLAEVWSDVDDKRWRWIFPSVVRNSLKIVDEAGGYLALEGWYQKVGQPLNEAAGTPPEDGPDLYEDNEEEDKQAVLELWDEADTEGEGDPCVAGINPVTLRETQAAAAGVSEGGGRLCARCLATHHMYHCHIVYSNSYRVPVLMFFGSHADGAPLTWNDARVDLPSQYRRHISDSRWTFVTQQEHPYLGRPVFAIHPCETSNWMRLLAAGESTPRRETTGADGHKEDDSPERCRAEGVGENRRNNATSHVHNSSSSCEDKLRGPNNGGNTQWGSLHSKSRGGEEAPAGYLLSWLSVVGPVVGLSPPLELYKTSSLALGGSRLTLWC